MGDVVSSDYQDDTRIRRHTVSRTSTGVTSSRDRRSSAPRRLNSTASENRSLLQPSTESGHSLVSSMLYITTSQCASPSLGPIFPPRSDKNTSLRHRKALYIVNEDFDSGLASLLQDMVLSEPLPEPSDIPTREPIYQNDIFDPQVLSYDLEQEHQQDAPMRYRRFAYDRDITPGEWSTLQEHVLALWNGDGGFTQARDAEMKTRTRVDEWNARFFNSRSMLLVLFAGNVAKGGSLSGWKETKIAFKITNDLGASTEEEDESITDSVDTSKHGGEPSMVPNRSRGLPYALVMYDLQRSHLPRAVQDARASRAPGFLLPRMGSPPTRKPLPKKGYSVPTNPRREKTASLSSAGPSTARGNAKRIFYSLATDRARIKWEVDQDKALLDSPPLSLTAHSGRFFNASSFLHSTKRTI
ncbi:SubName: Full=Uncharacterized protein {ECO:0000313/EMBL:CCA76624.1} [Serendipita indica DSM 11827]|nr:SubName: Full=Uncharacterized protein {ECO:0000313/EMBL:CCA76624.1} [Serendipita indica DSM 11827]